MKYGESLFDIVYLILVIVIGIKILLRNKSRLNGLMGSAVLILGCGDAFHLIPRILNYFINNDFNLYLGVGKLVTSITMTIFYVLVYYIYLKNYKVKEDKRITYSVWILLVIRIILCLFPQNGWFNNEGLYSWGIIRNIPFAVLGLIIVLIYFNKRNKDKAFKNIWLLVALSFVFYFIVILGASYIPMLGMFMIPKTICYILMVLAFNKKSTEKRN